MPTQAILIEQFGGTEVLQLHELPQPTAAPGQAVVRIRHAGVNFVDLYQREGRYPGISLPWRLGLEGAGEIVTAGGGFAVGDRVAFTTGVQGGYSTHLAVPVEHLVRVPDALPLRDAAAALELGLTAAMLLDDVARLRPGEPVLVHAAAGGVGGLGLFARHQGVAKARRQGPIKARYAARTHVAGKCRNAEWPLAACLPEGLCPERPRAALQMLAGCPTRLRLAPCSRPFWAQRDPLMPCKQAQVQWLVARGHPVFGTVSSAAKAEWLRGVGAVPLLADSDWAESARGVAVVFDSVGRTTFAGSLDALRVGGHLVLFGAASGQPDPVDVLALQKKSLTLTRPVLPHFLPDAAKRRARAATVFDALLTGAVQLRIHAEFPLAEAARAHELLASRATQGKLLLQP